jgi:hypothetical protein
MKKLFVGLGVAMAMGISGQSFAQVPVEIVWENPEKYTDVAPSNDSRKRFRERTFKHLNDYLNELAADLPVGNKLLLTVSDLDLAGRVWPASFVGLGHSGSDVRLIKRVDIPRINFSYQLVDANGQIVQQAAVKLKDMSFMNSARHLFRHDALGYEKNMLNDWFKQAFKAQLAQKTAQKKV